MKGVLNNACCLDGMTHGKKKPAKIEIKTLAKYINPPPAKRSDFFK